MFKILENKIGRKGGIFRKIEINGKIVETPLFMPTINSSNLGWIWRHGLQVDMIVFPLNELFERKNLLEQAVNNGIHSALDFNGVAMIDSGAFYYASRNIQKDCEEIYELQVKIKSDIAIILDEIPFKNLSKEENKKRIENTIENARKIKGINKSIPLEAIVHGNTMEEYAECARRLLEFDFDLYGVSVSRKLKIKNYGEAIRILRTVRRVIPYNKPVHALGCGSRNLISLLAYHGADIFDSTNYVIKAAYNQHYKRKTFCYFKTPTRESQLCSICLNKNNAAKEREEQQIAYNLLELMKENARIKCAIKHDDFYGYLKKSLPKTQHKYLL